MKEKKQGSRQNPKTGRGGGGTSYVVPEPDGVRSGHPLVSNPAEEHKAREFTPGALHQRMLGNRDRAGLRSPGDADPLLSGENLGGDMGGISIRTKLVGSLGALTLIILLMGIISLVVFRNGAEVSKEIATNHTTVLRLAEEVMDLTFRIEHAETEFLAGEKEDALDHIKLYGAKAHESIGKLLETGSNMHEKDLRMIEDWSEPYSDMLHRYETMFTQLIKEAESGESTLQQMETDTKRFTAQLEEKMETNRLLEKKAADEYYRHMEERLRGGGSPGRALTHAALLNDLLLETVQLHTEATEALSTGSSSVADSAIAGLHEARTQLERILRETNSETLKSVLPEIRKNLNAYAAVFKEAVTNG